MNGRLYGLLRRRWGIPVGWADAGTLSGVSDGTLNLGATTRTIDVEYRDWAETTGAIASASVEYRERGHAAATSWGIPAWPVRPDTGTYPYAWTRIIAQMILPDGWQGKTVQVRLALTDTNGLTVYRVGTVTVQSDPSDSYGPTADRYVSMTGTDSGAGGSGAPWRTLEYARANSSADDVIQVAPGSYAAPGAGAWPNGVWLRGEFAVVSNDGLFTVTAAANRSIIEPRGSDGWPAVAAPTGATDTDLTGRTPNRIAPWVKDTAIAGTGTGGVTARNWTAWKWTGSPIADASYCAYSTTRTGNLTNVLKWNRQASGACSTPGTWIETLRTNQWYSDAADQTTGLGTNGLYVEGFFSTAGGDLYLWVPGVADETNDPNTKYWWIGTTATTLLSLTGSDQRAVGFDCRNVESGITVAAPATNSVVERNLIWNCQYKIRLTCTHNSWASTGVASSYPTHPVIRHNYAPNVGLWSLTQSPNRTVPWNMAKSTMILFNGTNGPARELDKAEGDFVGGSSGGAKWADIHDNLCEGGWDFSGDFHPNADWYSCWGYAIHGNTVRGLCDDFSDMSRAATIVCFGNRIEHPSVFHSVAPVYGSVQLMYDNAIWQLGDRGTGLRNDGSTSLGCTGMKYDGASDPQALIAWINTTIWTNDGETIGIQGSTVGGSPAGGTGPSYAKLLLVNNLIRATKTSFDWRGGSDTWSDTTNEWHDAGTDNGKWGLRIALLAKNVIDQADDWTAYRATGFGLGSNPLDLDVTNVALIDAALGSGAPASDGDLTPSGALLGAGTVVAGLHTTTPDLGVITRRVA